MEQRTMLKSVFLLIAAIAMSARTGSGRSGSLLNVQSALRAHLARIEETPHGICLPEACQYWTPEPVCSPPLQLGEKARLGQNKAHFLVIGATSKGARAGVG